MINNTINQTISTGIMNNIDFGSWTSITTSIPFIIAVIAVVLLPFILYLLIGALTHARTSSGKKLETVMIQNPNFFIAIIVWTLLQSGLIVILLMYPFWLKFIN